MHALAAKVFKHRRLIGAHAVIVVFHRADQEAGKAAVRDKNIPDIPAALAGCLDLDAIQRMHQVTVPDPDILHAAGHFTADGNAQAALAETVKDPDMLCRPGNDIALRILSAFDRHRVIPGAEAAGKEGAVRAGVRIPPVAIPDAGRLEEAVVRDNMVRIDHMHIPACAVFQRQTGDAHMTAVAQVDQPPAGTSRNRIVVFVFLHLVAEGLNIAPEAFTLRLNDAKAQRLSAPADFALPIDQDIFTVRPGCMVQGAQIQEALVAFHLRAFKTAVDLREVILRRFGSHQHRAFSDTQRHIAVQTKRTGEIDALGNHHACVRTARVNRLLQCLRIHGFPVAHRAEVRYRDLSEAFSGFHGGFAEQFVPHEDRKAADRFFRKLFQSAVGCIRLKLCIPVCHSEGFFSRCLFGFFPPQRDRTVCVHGMNLHTHSRPSCFQMRTAYRAGALHSREKAGKT